MEYEFTYSNIPIKVKYNKIVAINTLNIEWLINNFLLCLPIELDIWLDIANVRHVETRSIYEFIALFDNYYFGPSSTSSEIICIASP
jgi:hypothetical protein